MSWYRGTDGREFSTVDGRQPGSYGTELTSYGEKGFWNGSSFQKY